MTVKPKPIDRRYLEDVVEYARTTTERRMAEALLRILDICDDPSTSPDGQKVTTIQRVLDAVAADAL